MWLPDGDLKESFWSEYRPPPRPQPGNQTQDWAPGTRLALRNTWTGVAPVGTCSQLGLELPATLIPGRKHSALATAASFFFFFPMPNPQSPVYLCVVKEPEKRERACEPAREPETHPRTKEETERHSPR